MLNLPQDFRDLLQILEANNVQYLIVGGYALSLYATPRTTGDIDIFVKIDPENATRILQSLNEFGFGGIGITQEDLLTPSQVFQLGYDLPSALKQYITTFGIEFERSHLYNTYYQSTPLFNERLYSLQSCSLNWTLLILFVFYSKHVYFVKRLTAFLFLLFKIQESHDENKWVIGS